MKMQKGICVKKNNSRSIFLLEDGRFLEGQAINPTEVGDEGYFEPASRRFGMSWAKFVAPVVALAAVLMLLFSTMLPSEEAYAYIQLEANPGIELGIDEDIKVISVRHLNKDGKKMIDQLGEWEGHSLDEILARSIDLASVSTKEEVTITTVAGEVGQTENLPVEQAVLAVAVAAVKKNVAIHLKKATHQQWKKSVQDNVPVGQKVKQFTPIAIEEEESILKTKGAGTAGGQVHPESIAPPGSVKKTDPDAKRTTKTVSPGQQKTPPGQQKKVDGSVNANPVNPVNPPKQEKKTAPPALEKKATPPGQATPPAPKPKEKAAAPKAEVKKAKPQPKEKKAAPPAKEQKVQPPLKDKKVKPAETTEKAPVQGTVKNRKTPEQKKKISNSQKKSSSIKGQK
jgi:hypothetical protein